MVEKKTASAILREGGNVLIVDDDTDTGEVVALTLVKAGYGVRLCSSREEAVMKLSRYQYDYVILDLFMPGLTAESFLEWIKIGSPRTKIILMTAAERAKVEAERLKLDRFIAKPFNTEEVLNALK